MIDPDTFLQGANARPTRAGPGMACRLAPVAILVAAIGAAFGIGLDDYLTFDTLRENRTFLMDFVHNRAILAVAIYLAVYALATALSLPGGAILTVAGGFLFGPWLGTGLTVVAATVGATGVFAIAKMAGGDLLRAKAGPALRKMEAGFRDNALSYLLVLRLIPLFPFFLVNLVPAFLGVPPRTYVLGTFIGIIPGSFVFTFVGAGLGSVFDSMEEFSASSALTPEVIAVLVGLAVLSLLPVVYKKFKARGGSTSPYIVRDSDRDENHP